MIKNRLRIVISNLNLRVEEGKKNLDYKLDKKVAFDQLFYEADIYMNSEDMICDRAGFDSAFERQNYVRVDSFSGADCRGNSIWVRDKYNIEKRGEMAYPSMLHARITDSINDFSMDIITLRIQVTNGSASDFQNRRDQFFRVLHYIDTESEKGNLNKSRLVFGEDFNNAKIRNIYKKKHAQYCYNYQLIRDELKKRNLMMGYDNLTEDHLIHSYWGWMLIDHIAIGSDLKYIKQPEYSTDQTGAPIGTPDHAVL